MSVARSVGQSAYLRKDPSELENDWKEVVTQRLEAMATFDANASLRYRLGSDGTLNYMVGGDLAAKLPIGGPPQDKAIRFVRSWGDLVSSPDELSASRLSLKMPLKSLMGDHFILESRVADDEEPTKSFTLHFDRSERLVFFTAIYQPSFAHDQAALDEMSEHQQEIDESIAALRIAVPAPKPLPRWLTKGQRRDAIVKTAVQWLPDYQAQKELPYVQVKFSAAMRDWVCYIDRYGKIASFQESSSQASPRVAAILDRFWESPAQVTTKDGKLRRVILMGLVTDRALAPLEGRYVSVYDHVNDANREEGKLLGDLSSGGRDKVRDYLASVSTTLLDRALAYYHIDLIQRYFRTLGLTALDDYDELNPLEVHLGPIGDLGSSSRYLHESKILVFPQIGGLSARGCTQARSLHILFHEYVHAVTDVIARLGRGRALHKSDSHLRQVIQAKAIDEGLADYFACSFAERHGARRAQVGELVAMDGNDGNKQLQLPQAPTTRDLDGPKGNEIPKQSLKRSFDDLLGKCETAFPSSVDGTNPQEVYDLSLLWSRFLWRFRGCVDRDVADMVIANSIFFLTRWATFGLALQALLTADRLLFDGICASELKADPAFSAFQDWEAASPRRSVTGA